MPLLSFCVFSTKRKNPIDKTYFFCYGFLQHLAQVNKRMNDSGEFALGRHRRSNATLSQVKGLGRDANLKSTLVHRRGNRPGNRVPRWESLR